METIEIQPQEPTMPKRYELQTDKKNQVIVEEVNKNELETVWKTLSELQLLF